MLSLLSTLCELVGAALLLAVAFHFDPWVGVFSLGVLLVAVGYFLDLGGDTAVAPPDGES